jgi:hypothetical protein
MNSHTNLDLLKRSIKINDVPRLGNRGVGSYLMLLLNYKIQYNTGGNGEMVILNAIKT